MPITPDPGVLHGYKNPDESPLNADGYFGTDPIYQNHANDTDEPLNSDPEGDPAPEGHVVEVEGAKPAGEAESESDEPKEPGEVVTPVEPEAPAKPEAKSSAKK